jgi:integrase
MNVTENVCLAYFADRAKHVKPSSPWSEYSMVKSSLLIKKNIDLKHFFKLTAFMKRQSAGYQCKKSKVFSKDQIYKFINEAPDETYLMMKVVSIFGIAGACRREEFLKMSTKDIEDTGSILVVKIPDTKTNKPRTFVIDGRDHDIKNMVEIYRRYVSLRPSHTKHERLFVFYRNGKCSTQPVGINTFGKIPSDIAKYLGLTNPHEYSGHTFRR